jgi:hypothetical protein
MTGLKLLMAVSLLTGVVAEQCDLGSLDVAEFADTVTVTNVSTAGQAFVVVQFDNSKTAWHLAAGTSRTATGLLVTKYTVFVGAPNSSRWNTYRERLVEARDELRDLTLKPSASGDEVANAAAQLLVVVGTLQQIGSDDSTQSCSGIIESGVAYHVSVEYQKTQGGDGLWVLDCA